MKIIWVLALILGVFFGSYCIPAYINTKEKPYLIGAIISAITVIVESIALIIS